MSSASWPASSSACSSGPPPRRRSTRSTPATAEPPGTAYPAGAILAIMPTLAVIGAGPKGIAIAAKARALTAAGFPAPRVVLIEPGPVAGNWTGHQGYTNGLLPLGTPPEKDVGYPYAESWGAHSAAVTAAMSDYSWQRHLIARGTYADWVDRGRLRPTHRQWSYYLREVADRVEAEIVSVRPRPGSSGGSTPTCRWPA